MIFIFVNKTIIDMSYFLLILLKPFIFLRFCWTISFGLFFY